MRIDGAPISKEIRFSWGRFVFLGILSLALCNLMSFSSSGALLMLSFLSIFAPVPLAIAFLLYGRTRGAALLVSIFIFVTILSFPFPTLSDLSIRFLLSGIYGVLVAETVLRNIHPAKGFVAAGLTLVALALLYTIFYALIAQVSPQAEVEAQIGTFFQLLEKWGAQSLSGQQEKLVVMQQALALQLAYVKKLWPSFVVIGLFMVLWVNMFVVLRNSHFWRERIKYSFFVGDFIRFKVPYYFVYPLILFLGLALAGDYVGGEFGETIGLNLLYCLGIFYFFQGLGVYLSLLTFLRIFRFLRTLLVLFTITAEPKILFAAGVLDIWFDFRRFFKKKGDIS